MPEIAKFMCLQLNSQQLIWSHVRMTRFSITFFVYWYKSNKDQLSDVKYFNFEIFNFPMIIKKLGAPKVKYFVFNNSLLPYDFNWYSWNFLFSLSWGGQFKEKCTLYSGQIDLCVANGSTETPLMWFCFVFSCRNQLGTSKIKGMYLSVPAGTHKL